MLVEIFVFVVNSDQLYICGGTNEKNTVISRLNAGLE